MALAVTLPEAALSLVAVLTSPVSKAPATAGVVATLLGGLDLQ